VDASQGSALKSALRANTAKNGPADLFPSVEVPILAQNNTRDDFHPAAVEMRGSLSGRKPGCDVFGELERSFPHSDQAAKNDYRFFFQKSFPFQLGNFPQSVSASGDSR